MTSRSIRWLVGGLVIVALIGFVDLVTGPDYGFAFFYFIPIVPVYGEELHIDGRRRLRSLVRDAKDPQRMFNYWRTTSTELVALAPKTPFIGRKGAFETDSAKWATANIQSRVSTAYTVSPIASSAVNASHRSGPKEG